MREPGDVNEDGIHTGVTGPPAGGSPTGRENAKFADDRRIKETLKRIEDENTEKAAVEPDAPQAHTRQVKPGDKR